MPAALHAARGALLPDLVAASTTAVANCENLAALVIFAGPLCVAVDSGHWMWVFGLFVCSLCFGGCLQCGWNGSAAVFRCIFRRIACVVDR